jgi:hypothetical protein
MLHHGEYGMSIKKGICYQPFPKPYDPSTANTTCLFFGSDIASDPFTPLFGFNYSSSKGSTCSAGEFPAATHCREDLETLKQMGVEVIRLYDWEPRNSHRSFTNACRNWNKSLLVPVSNYFLQPDQGFPNRENLIPALIRSFANEAGTDYDPVVAGVIFGNELAGYGAEQCVTFTQDWARIEAAQFPGFRRVKLGHPVQFAPFGARFPCFGFWNKLVPPLKKTPAIASRLFLAPQTYNDAYYLFENAEGSGSGWVDQAWKAYELPIWFTEIGMDRTKSNHVKIVTGQLQGVMTYSGLHPDRLIGACFFQFADKVWKLGTSEGSYGAFTHSSDILCNIHYSIEDFKIRTDPWGHHFDGNQTLHVDKLVRTDLYGAVTSVYNPG